MLRDIQYKRRLTHGRTGCDQHQVRGLHSGGTIVQINESGGNTCDGSVQFGSLLDLVHGVHDYGTNRYEFLDVFLLYHFIDLALGTLQNRIQALLAAITGIGNLFIGTDQTPECRLLRHDSSIILDIGGSRYCCNQIRQEIQSTDLGRHILLGSQPILQSDKVNGLSFIVQLYDGVKYHTVLPVVEILSGDLLCGSRNGFRVNEHRADDRLLRL